MIFETTTDNNFGTNGILKFLVIHKISLKFCILQFLVTIKILWAIKNYIGYKGKQKETSLVYALEKTARFSYCFIPLLSI